MNPILQIENLNTHFETARGTVRAVDGVDLRLNEGDSLGIAGESGCGSKNRPSKIFASESWGDIIGQIPFVKTKQRLTRSIYNAMKKS